MSTRKVIRQLMCPLVGGRTGTFGTGGTTTAGPLSVAAGTTLDNAYLAYLLLMPDAVLVADQNRVLTAWTGLTGTAGFGARTNGVASTETYELCPPDWFGLQEINDAIDRVLQKTRRSVLSALPTIDNQQFYPLTNQSWVRNEDDVRRVTWRNSPNFIDNSYFKWWGAGSTSAPTNWALAGTGATVSQSTSYVYTGQYSALVTRVGNDATLTHTIGGGSGLSPDTPVYAERTYSVVFGCWVRCAVAARARVGINDGIGTTYSSYHTGDGTLQFLTATRVVTASTSTALQFILSVDTGNTNAYFSNPVACEGTVVPVSLQNNGDAAYQEYPIYDYHKQGRAIYLNTALSRGKQLLVYSGQPYPKFASDADTTEAGDMLVIAGTICELAGIDRLGKDRTRMIDLVKKYAPTYTRLAAIEYQRKPLSQPSGVVVTGA